MQVRNVHERVFTLPLATVGALIDSLASRGDRLWPVKKWPPMRFDRPLAVGAVGGHGPVRYSVEKYLQGQMIVFRFSAPRGFGVFSVRARKTGIGRNPRTGTEVSITPGKAVRFKPGKELHVLETGAPAK